MSCYDDIYNDFPLRCAKLWRKFNDAAKAEDLDVTFMLMCAAGGFATPWEHLKILAGQGKVNQNHPAFFNYDERKYARSLKVMEKALSGRVVDSPLFQGVGLDHCFYAHAKSIELIRDLAEYGTPSDLDLGSQGSRQIVKALRNAIAHNNIYAFSKKQQNVISDLAFFSEVLVSQASRDKVIDHYEVLVFRVDDFRSFLTSWFALLDAADKSGRHLKLVISNAMENDDQRVAAHG